MTETANGGRIVPLRHPRLVRGFHRAFGRARGEPLWGGAPRSVQPPEAVYSGGGARIRDISAPGKHPASSLISALVLTTYLSAIYILRHEPLRHYHIIQLAGTNKKTSFVVGGSSCVRLLAIMYSTGISSSQLGTKSPGFVLNRNPSDILQT